MWNSIVRRKKRNHLDLSGKEESDGGSVCKSWGAVFGGFFAG